MLLVVDMGNTNTVFGMYDGDRLLFSCRIVTSANRTADETGMFIYTNLSFHGFDPKGMDAAIISSVVPSGLPSLAHGIKKYFGIDALIVNYKMNLGGLKLPPGAGKEVGTDRLVNNCAALELYGGPCLIIDYGTATTYDVVDGQGAFLSGVTAPGIRISADALFKNASLLGMVELSLPPSVIATSTTESLQAGILFGAIGETEYIVRRTKDELGISNLKVIATGGMARVIIQGTGVIDEYNPILTLEGLRILYALNK
jgi:type III pantothenate kinase